MQTDTPLANTITREDFQALTAQEKHLGDCILALAAVVDGIDNNVTDGNRVIDMGVSKALNMLNGIKDPESVKTSLFGKTKL